ncbi:gag-polyprotein putative aspartyl protease domain-containing protein [Phthorimaea operculella]|nr:gag-polyprotein putative aspartyl protease domain-containing protein [Phthorimaea operculella]
MGLLNQKAHGSTEAEVHQVQKKWNKPKHYENDGGPCRKCGKTPKHRFTECEAANSTCKTCGIKGHWMSVCRYNKSKKEGRAPRNVHQVEIQNNEDEFFFGTIDRKIDSVLNKKNKAKFVDIKVNDQFVRFKVDTGASDTVISPELHKSLNLPDPIPVDEKLWGPCKMLLPGRGVCRNVKMTWQGRTKATDIYILKDQETPLLGLTECDAFGIIKWHEEAQVMQVSSELKPEDEFSQVFQGLGTMEGKYNIQIKEDAIPYAVSAPRNISVPIKEKVEKAINELKDMGVIEPITHPTLWCAPMVPIVTKSEVPGKDKVRITVDYTEQ